MANSLANTLNFLGQEAGLMNRQIPAPSQAALDVQQQFAPGQRPTYQNPLFQALSMAPSNAYNSLAGFLNKAPAALNMNAPGIIENRNQLMIDEIARQTQ